MPTKGQTLSKEAISKMKESKRKRLLSKYNWVIAEPYLDVVVDNGSTGKNKEVITLREFKQRINEGETLSSLRKDGISKHLLQFFSNFCQGKIDLPKEEFEECYLKGMSLDEIASEHKVERGHLTFLRQLYQIKRKGATYIQRKKTEVSLTQRQKEIIYGSLMGDAKRQHTKWLSSVEFGQCEAQKDYLMWKYLELANLVSENSLSFYDQFDKRYGSLNKSYRFYTMANSGVEEILIQFYKTGKKVITQEILDNLTELSLAVWFMDDGTSNFFENRRNRTGWDITPEVKLCTDSFSEEECNLIIEWLRGKWGINSHYRQKRGRVIIDSVSVYDFFDLIRPHIIPSMMYKIDYDAYVEYREKKESII